MRRIGLTGGIGTGKSTVSAYLKKRGIDVLDADTIAREVVEPGSKALCQLTGAFGSDILLADGSLDRKKLGALAFHDQKKKDRMDQIMHKEIMEHIQLQLLQLEKQGTAFVIIDAPLLLETGLKEMVEWIWLVDTDEASQLERVRQRDGLSEDEILDRMKHQMPRQEKQKLAHVVIDNSKDMPYLYEQVDALLKVILDGGKQ